MFRWVLAALVVALGLLTWQALRARDQAPAQQEAAADKVEKKEGSGEKAFAALMKGLEEAIDVAESKEEVEKVRQTYAKKLYDHARAHPGDKTAVDGLLLVVRMTKPGAEGVRKDAVGLLMKAHVKTPHLTAETIKGLSSGFFDPDLVRYMQAVAKESPDKATRAHAYKALVQGRDRGLRFIGELKKEEDLRKQVEKDLGAAFVKNLMGSEEAFKKEKADYLAKLRGELKGVVPDVMPGAVAPDVEAADLSGKAVKVSDYRGKVVVLDFWGTFCRPCLMMIPDSQKLVKAMKGKPFAFVSVSADEEKSAVTEFLKKTDMPWDHWWVGSGSKFQRAWDVEGFPTVYVIDHKGVIRYAQVGYSEEDKIAKEVEKLVKEAEAEKK